MRENYLVEHTVGSIIRSAFKIYFGNFGTLFLIYVLPVVPVALIQQEAQLAGDAVLIVLSVLLTLIVVLFAYGATAVAVSDVCLGNAPSFKRSYAKILSKSALLLLVTNVLQLLAMVVGLVLLVIPGLVVGVWFMLAPTIVVLEAKSGIAALKRSKQLGDGSHWRNGGLILLLTIIGAVIGGVIGGVFGFLFPDLLTTWIFRVLVGIIQQGLVVPITFIAVVLVYYDRRVRKEGYDAKALAEDLAR